MIKQKLSNMSLEELEIKGEELSHENIEDALFLYRFWLDKELATPSETCFLTGKPEISADLDRDYGYLLLINKRYDELLEYYRKILVVNTSQALHGLEGSSRTIKDRDEAIDFIEKALLICPKTDKTYNSLISNLNKLKHPSPKKTLLIDRIDKEKIFDYIGFEHGLSYYPNIPVFYPENSLPLNEVAIPLGQSRYGGPVVDLPKNMIYPEGLLFVASLDLAEFSKFDTYELLPKKGQLYFFWSPDEGKQETFYADIVNDELTRVIKEHGNNFYIGSTIENIQKGQERFSDRYCIDDEDEIEEQEGNTEWMYNNLVWDSSAGSEKSKVFGVFTHCQYDPNDIAEKTYSDNVLLLQVGENSFNDEGVLSVMINKGDLKKLNFSNCIYEWAQT